MDRVKCLYGSVTGQAKSVAEQIIEVGQSKGLEISLDSLGDVGKTWKLEEAKTIIIVSSTTGDGEQPENVIKFVRKLRPKTLSSDHLAHVRFALLGLGDTNYNKFCAAPKFLLRRLSELGAKPFHPPAWADDGTGLEEVVEPWIEGLWGALEVLKGETMVGEDGGENNEKGESEVKEVKIMSAEGEKHAVGSESKEAEGDSLTAALSQLSISPSTPLSLPPCPKSYISVKYTGDKVPLPSTPILPLSPLPSSSGPPLSAQVLHCKLITSNMAVKLYYEVVLSCPAFDHMAGDTVSIVCENTEEEVNDLCSRLQLGKVWGQECILSISPDTKKPKAKLPTWLPTTTSLEMVFKHFLDIRAVPKKPLLRSLLEHTNGEEDKKKLAILCSKEGSQEYMAKVRDSQMTLMELLAFVPSCNPPVTLLLEQVPRLNPRPYSLSSSPLATPDTISWVFTLVKDPRPGLATTWLSKLQAQSEVLVQPRTGHHFRPPQDLGQSYVMVGAGSGLGPFMGFLEERRARKRNGEEISGSCWLVFGCRSKDNDFLYKEVLEDMVKEGVLSKLSVAFSREEGGPRYVQDSIRENKEKLVMWLVDMSASFYVCGDAKGMARGVQEVVEQVVEMEKGWEEGEGVKYVKKMREENKYKEDIWT